MKIGIDISQIVYEGTGVGVYTRNLVKNLLRQNKKHDFILFGASLRRKNILDEFVKELDSEKLKFKTSFWLLPPSFISSIWNQIHHVKIERLIGKIDLFHSSDWTEPPTKAKKVTTIHDLIAYKFPETLPNEIVANQKRKLAWAKKESNAIIAVSENTKKDITKILGIPAPKISVIYEAVGEEFGKTKNSEKVKQKYNLNKPYVLAMGGVGKRKNIQNLTDAFNNLNRPDLELFIIGKSNFVSQEDLPGLFAGAQAFAYPSLYEGFGLPILEAFSCDCPVVSSNSSSLPEVGGEAAIYFRPESVSKITGALKKVLELTPNTRQQLIDKGHRQLKKFSWDKAAKETLKLYEDTFASDHH